MSNLIITHPGSAHFDEFLAISLVLGTYPDEEFILERRNPEKVELNDPWVWVIDIGGRLEPHLKNFDHHHDLNVSASFILVADYLDLTPKLETNPWWSFKDKIDRLGPLNVAKEFGLNTIIQTFSPLEEWFLTHFAKDPEGVQPYMRAFGEAIIADAEKLAKQLNYWKSCDIIEFKNKRILIGYTDESFGLEDYNRQLPQKIDISITFDRRGPGWRLYRFDDTGGIDFSRLENHAEIFFAHKGGFLAKTKTRLPLKRLFDIIALALPVA